MIRAASSSTSVTVLRPEPHSIVYCALPYAMEGLFSLERTYKKDNLVTEVGGVLLRRTAVDVDFEHRLVHLDDDTTVTYGKLLIASGAAPVRPPLPGMDLANVYTVKTAADATAIMNRIVGGAECDAIDTEADEPATAVVIGSGAIGIEQATAYRARGLTVHLVEMQDHVLPHLVDTDMAGSLHDELLELGIKLHLEAPLEELRGDVEVDEVRLAGGTSIALKPGRDLVVIAAGMAPEIGFLRAGSLETVKDGIVVDERMRTSAPDVWAAGDCTAFYSGIDGQPLGGKLATNAVPMAKVAARDMLGLSARYPGFFNGAATVVGSHRVAGTGFTERFARSRGLEVYSTHGGTMTRFPMMPGAGKVRVKLIFQVGTDRLVGGQVVGTEAVAERVDLLTFAIQQGAKAQDLEAFSYSAQPWQTFFPARNAIVEAAAAATARKVS